MKCDKCNEKEATFLYEELRNGKKRSYHLCHDCAKALGLTNQSGFMADDIFGSLQSGFPNLLQDIFGSAAAKPREGKRCSGCNATWQEIAQEGKVGCPACYQSFAEELERSIRSIHGNVTHTGRAPTACREANEKKRRIADLRAGLRAAIESENFEEAARLRDLIRAEEQ